MNFASRDFRNALGMFPTGVTVITGIGRRGQPIGVTANSFSSVSLDPPLISFNIARTLASFEDLLTMESFAVNLLTEAQSEVSTGFARANSDKWACTDSRPGHTGNPVIVPHLAVFECARFAIHEAGDHMLIVGRVLHFQFDENERPLVFFRGSYRGVGGPVAGTEQVKSQAATRGGAPDSHHI